MLDEGGFYLLPGVHKTYAPRGWRISLRVPLTREHLSVVGGFTPEGDLSVHIQKEPLNGWNVIVFLTHLLRRFGKLLIVWDRSPIHRSDLVNLFIRQVGQWYLKTEFFPAYAPDLNPVEQLWQQLKHEELPNISCQDLGHLAHELNLGINRIRMGPSLVQSFFGEPGLNISEYIRKKV